MPRPVWHPHWNAQRSFCTRVGFHEIRYRWSEIVDESVPLGKPEHVERKLAAILAADIVGYSRLMGADEVGTLRTLKAVRKEHVDPTIAAYGGRIVKTTGDGLLADFQSVVEAVACAVAIQRKMIERNRGIADEKRIVFRLGINIGDIIIDGAIFSATA
jgi:class 3 adenylate cyclase